MRAAFLTLLLAAGAAYAEESQPSPPLVSVHVETDGLSHAMVEVGDSITQAAERLSVAIENAEGKLTEDDRLILKELGAHINGLSSSLKTPDHTIRAARPEISKLVDENLEKVWWPSKAEVNSIVDRALLVLVFALICLVGIAGYGIYKLYQATVNLRRFAERVQIIVEHPESLASPEAIPQAEAAPKGPAADTS